MQRGFTLIELLTAVAVLSILVAIGVPQFKSLIASQKIRTAAASLQASLNLTRSEALKRNANVMLSPVGDGDWTSGWKITDTSGTTLFVAPAVSAVTITGPTAIIYQGVGRPSLTSEQTFAISSSNSSIVRCVEVGLSGIAAISSSGC